jgi:hypothetical protein
MRSIWRHNFRANLYGHFNNMRSYALNDESALLVSTYPKGRRPRQPFPYATEAWTGLEYTAAAGMLYEGQTQAGLRIIQAVRGRHDGLKRNPFDEPECGHHYARAMASWAAVLALTGFHYSAVRRKMTFAPREGTFFWSNGYTWGTFSLAKQGGAFQLELSVLHGKLTLEQLELTAVNKIELDRPLVLSEGGSGQWQVNYPVK